MVACIMGNYRVEHWFTMCQTNILFSLSSLYWLSDCGLVYCFFPCQKDTFFFNIAMCNAHAYVVAPEIFLRNFFTAL